MIETLIKKGSVMAEPTTSAGAYGASKFAIFGLPIAASLLAVGLGLRVVPLKKGNELKDAVNRLIGAFATSIALGVFALVFLKNSIPWLFPQAADLAVYLGLHQDIGTYSVMGVVFMICGLPGWWAVSAIVLWFERRKNKDIQEMIKDVSDQLKELKK